MQQQEELAALFSRNLSLDPAAAPKEPESQIVYISQHYTHSAHVAVAPKALDVDEDQYPAAVAAAVLSPSLSPRPASEPPQSDHAADEGVLRAHGIDTVALSPPQLQLFRAAEPEQRRRLVELWRAAPPTSCLDNPTLAWSFTTVEQEERLARARWEQQQTLAQRTMAETVMSLDGTPLTPVQQNEDGRWMVPMSQSYMEPYMTSGYEELARREYEDSARRAYAEAAVGAGGVREKEGFLGGGVEGYSSAADPVYQTTNSGVDWRMQQQVAMENQYGRMMVLRNDDEEML